MHDLQGKRILVTGGAGFLGREVCRELHNYRPSKIIVARSRQYDLRRQSAACQLLADARPEVVIHLAAVVGGIGANRANPGKYFYENAVMGVQLMEESRLAGVEKFVGIGTICAYPKHTPAPFKEDDLWNGFPEETNAPYGLAKKMLLVQAQAYRQQYGLNAITLLPVNLYGPGDNFDPETSHVIPALIRKMLAGAQRRSEFVEVWGSGTVSREFLYVGDAARAIALAADRYSEAAPVNIGTGNEIRIRELADLIAGLCGYEGSLHWNAALPDGQPRRVLDIQRAREKFGFEASTSLVDGLRKTIDWYVQHQDEISATTTQPAAHQNPGTSRSFSMPSAAGTTIHIASPRASGLTYEGNGRARRALITGITGQDGSYLAELLLAKGYEVHGLIRRSSSFNTQRIEHLYRDPHETGRLHLHYGDLMDGSSLTGLVLEVEPDEIYNLAAQSHVRVSFDQPVYSVDAAALGTLRVLEAARCLHRHRPVRVYQASSSEMFGDAGEVPQSEGTPFRPCSPYACAKVFAYHQTVNYREAYGLFACNGILFNHESPRRGETFVTRKITMAAARIRESLQSKLYLGNLDARRDWGFAKDYVEAMWLMLQQPEPDDYVIATGESHSVREFLEAAFELLELNWRAHVEIDPRYFRPTEVPLLLGDASKAREKLGWEPRTTFVELVATMVDADWQLAKQDHWAQQRPQTAAASG